MDSLVVILGVSLLVALVIMPLVLAIRVSSYCVSQAKRMDELIQEVRRMGRDSDQASFRRRAQ